MVIKVGYKDLAALHHVQSAKILTFCIIVFHLTAPALEKHSVEQYDFETA